MQNFTIEEDGNNFLFNSMNRRRIQLFQVYVTHEGQPSRFHMQINEDTGEFSITDKDNCPEVYHKCEKIFNDAIKIYGTAVVIPT